MKKVILVFSVIILLLSTTLSNKTYANPVVPAVVAGGIGISALAGASAAALEGVRGFENAQTTWDIANTVWNTADAMKKQAIENAVITAVEMGAETVTFTQDVIDWWNEEFGAQARAFNPINNEELNTYYSQYFDKTCAACNHEIQASVTSLDATPIFSYVMSNGNAGNSRFLDILGNYSKTELTLKIGSQKVVILSNPTFYPETGLADLSVSQIMTLANMIASAGGATIAVDIPINPIDNWAEELDRILANVLTGVNATGLNIALGDVVATTLTGDMVKWNPNTRTWEDSKGVPLNPDIPVENVRVKPKENTGEENPPIEENPPVTGEYGGILGSILAKLTAILTALTTGLIGDFGNVDWEKLKLTGQAFSTKFPFSLPWDVGRALSAIFGPFNTSDIPSWDIRFTVLGNSFEWVLTIPEFFHSWFTVLKTMILVMFDITLVYSVRKLLGGAS